MSNTVEKVAEHYGLGYLYLLGEDILINKILRTMWESELLQIQLVSKTLYVYANDEELWKRLCIRRHKGYFTFKKSWKLTTLFQDRIIEHEFKPIPVPHFNSKKFQERWYRTFVDINHFRLEKETIERIDGRQITVEQFIERYEKTGTPVIITGLMDDWPAMENWKRDALIERFGETKFKTDEVRKKSRKLRMKLRDYFIYATYQKDEDPIYLFDPRFAQHTPELLNDYTVPPFFAREDLFNDLSKDERPFFRWIVIGPERSGSPFHLDPYYTTAWNALISGEKRWAVYPRGVTPPGGIVFTDDDYDSDDPVKWFVEVYPKLTNEQKPIEFVQKRGEIVWIPSMVWHMVLNLTETIAVTQNYCNTYNFKFAWPEVCKEPLMATEMIDLHALSRPDLFTMDVLNMAGKDEDYLIELKRIHQKIQLENQNKENSLNNTDHNQDINKPLEENMN